ncbi:MAG: glycine zipper 2TM domain-containing protein [Betaproteobacteria bacterium]|nr:glycine zipper 2TM domain-containing protein [Betaproteobacteria bacterium]
MEASNKKPGLHPLLTAAAVSVTVFSAVGIAAITGLLPHSFGSSKEASTLSQPAPAQGLDQVQARSAETASAAAATDMPPAATVSTPPAKPVHKPAKKHVADASSAPAPVPGRDSAGTPPPPPPPSTVVVQAPPPAPAGIAGTVESVREVSTPAQHSNGVGPVAGGIAGAVLGSQVGHGAGRDIATVLGAAAGAFGGAEVEKQARATKHWEITVRLDDGTSRTVKSDYAPIWHGGERIRYQDGRLTPAA